MPRKLPIDAPRALQHIIGRGINRQAIFSDKADYEDFLEVRSIPSYWATDLLGIGQRELAK